MVLLFICLVKCIEVLHIWSKYGLLMCRSWGNPTPIHKYLGLLTYGISMLQKFSTYMNQ